MNFFTKVILGSVAVLLVAITVVLLFRSREAGRVEAIVREAAGWVKEGRGDLVAGLVDDQFHQAEDARAEIKRRIKPGVFSKVELVSVKVDVEGDEARTEVRYKLPFEENPYPELVQTAVLHWRRRAEGWKIVDYEGTRGLR